MSISSELTRITNARDAIRAKMIAANQASSGDDLTTLANNLTISTGTPIDILTSYASSPDSNDVYSASMLNSSLGLGTTLNTTSKNHAGAINELNSQLANYMYGRVLTYFIDTSVAGHHNNVSFTVSGNANSSSTDPSSADGYYNSACYIGQLYSGTAYIKYSDEIDLTQYRELDVRISGTNIGGSGNTYGKAYVIIEKNGSEIKSIQVSGKYKLYQIDVGDISGSCTIGLKLVHVSSGMGCSVGFNSVILLPFYCPTS